MKRVIGVIILLLCSFLVVGEGDLIVELGEHEILPRDGFSETVFLPFKITNIGDESVTSRLPVKQVRKEGRSGVGYPLYIYSGELQIVGEEPLKKAPFQKGNGTIYWKPTITTEVDLGDGIIPAAPAVEIEPGESVLFYDKEIIGGMTTFSFSDSGTYEIGYEVDPADHTNEIAESNDHNNEATVTLDLEIHTYVKGPNEEIGLDENQYWFYFKELGDCVTLDLPLPTNICIQSQGSFTTTLLVDSVEITLFHLWEFWGWSKTFKNLEFVAGDGYLVTYS